MKYNLRTYLITIMVLFSKDKVTPKNYNICITV